MIYHKGLSANAQTIPFPIVGYDKPNYFLHSCLLQSVTPVCEFALFKMKKDEDVVGNYFPN